MTEYRFYSAGLKHGNGIRRAGDQPEPLRMGINIGVGKTGRVEFIELTPIQALDIAMALTQGVRIMLKSEGAR